MQESEICEVSNWIIMFHNSKCCSLMVLNKVEVQHYIFNMLHCTHCVLTCKEQLSDIMHQKGWLWCGIKLTSWAHVHHKLYWPRPFLSTIHTTVVTHRLGRKNHTLGHHFSRFSPHWVTFLPNQFHFIECVHLVLRQYKFFQKNGHFYFLNF